QEGVHVRVPSPLDVRFRPGFPELTGTPKRIPYQPVGMFVKCSLPSGSSSEAIVQQMFGGAACLGLSQNAGCCWPIVTGVPERAPIAVSGTDVPGGPVNVRRSAALALSGLS